jgi:sarcosine oxidase gamma subunit
LTGDAGPLRVRRVIGVYDADGTVFGELSYLVRARLGRAHCALCDITHGRVRVRADWERCRDSLSVPFVTFHRNDQPEAVRAAADGRLPVVVAECEDGTSVVLLGPDELAACAGSPERLVEAVQAAIADA